MDGLTRREFLTRTLAAGATGAAVMAAPKKAYAAGEGTVGTFIDLTKCQGCGECVAACKVKNEGNYPQPVADIPDNWPTGKKEDWSDKKDLTDRLTPYNWLFVEKIEVEGRTVNIPRRCMHCDNPPCANLCPFSAQEKTSQGAVVIDHDKCLGGAKCRSVCPWDVPQRQAGVGVYMKLAPGLLGGGVMYKCDLCSDLISQGQRPACVAACPTGAAQFGDKADMKQLAEQRAQEVGGFIYGAEENGGTSTFYVSDVPFEAIDEAIDRRKAELPDPMKTSVPGMTPGVENYLDSADGIATGFAIAPVAGIAAATFAAARILKGESK